MHFEAIPEHLGHLLGQAEGLNDKQHGNQQYAEARDRRRTEAAAADVVFHDGDRVSLEERWLVSVEESLGVRVCLSQSTRDLQHSKKHSWSHQSLCPC